MPPEKYVRQNPAKKDMQNFQPCAHLQQLSTAEDMAAFAVYAYFGFMHLVFICFVSLHPTTGEDRHRIKNRNSDIQLEFFFRLKRIKNDFSKFPFRSIKKARGRWGRPNLYICKDLAPFLLLETFGSKGAFALQNIHMMS